LYIVRAKAPLIISLGSGTDVPIHTGERATCQLLHLKTDMPFIIGIGTHHGALLATYPSLVWRVLAKHG
jgi:hypothetical protein